MYTEKFIIIFITRFLGDFLDAHQYDYTPTRIKGRAINLGGGQDGREFFGVFYNGR